MVKSHVLDFDPLCSLQNHSALLEYLKKSYLSFKSRLHVRITMHSKVVKLSTVQHHFNSFVALCCTSEFYSHWHFFAALSKKRSKRLNCNGFNFQYKIQSFAFQYTTLHTIFVEVFIVQKFFFVLILGRLILLQRIHVQAYLEIRPRNRSPIYRCPIKIQIEKHNSIPIIPKDIFLRGFEFILNFVRFLNGLIAKKWLKFSNPA